MFIVRVFDGEENKWLKHSMNSLGIAESFKIIFNVSY